MKFFAAVASCAAANSLRAGLDGDSSAALAPTTVLTSSYEDLYFESMGKAPQHVAFNGDLGQAASILAHKLQKALENMSHDLDMDGLVEDWERVLEAAGIEKGLSPEEMRSRLERLKVDPLMQMKVEEAIAVLDKDWQIWWREHQAQIMQAVMVDSRVLHNLQRLGSVIAPAFQRAFATVQQSLMQATEVQELIQTLVKLYHQGQRTVMKLGQLANSQILQAAFGRIEQVLVRSVSSAIMKMANDVKTVDAADWKKVLAAVDADLSSAIDELSTDLEKILGDDLQRIAEEFSKALIDGLKVQGPMSLRDSPALRITPSSPASCFAGLAAAEESTREDRESCKSCDGEDSCKAALELLTKTARQCSGNAQLSDTKIFAAAVQHPSSMDAARASALQLNALAEAHEAEFGSLCLATEPAEHAQNTPWMFALASLGVVAAGVAAVYRRRARIEAPETTVELTAAAAI